MEFDFSPHTVSQWRELISQAPQANWMQSWPYAKASYLRDYKSSKPVIIKKNGGPIGFMALQEIKMGPVHFLDLNRGPLWFNSDVHESTLFEFSNLFQEEYRRRWMQRRRWLPEWEKSTTADSFLKEAGFQSLPQSFETSWIDLQKPVSELRRNLHQKWRNSLHKAERGDIEVIADRKAQLVEIFLRRYEDHKKQKGFHGVSSAFLREEIRHALPFQEALLLGARHEGELVAGAYFLIHGLTISYRMGWNSPGGRKTNAHYLLLWSALEYGIAKNLKSFDLGGLKPLEAPGVTQFKMGLGGTERKLLGLYR